MSKDKYLPSALTKADKVSAKDKYIKLEDLQKFPIRIDHYDKEHGSEKFVFGVESVLEYAEYLPTYDVPMWISVEDRLPDCDGKYLVYTRRDLIHTMYYYATNAYEFEHWGVTHWMPLPEAPKMKGGEE